MHVTLFEKAAREAGFHIYNTMGPSCRMLKGWHWIRSSKSSARGSRHYYDTMEEAWRACCKANGVNLVAALDAFTRHYLVAALWSSGVEFDEYSIDDFSPYALNVAWTDCRKFQEDNKLLLESAYHDYRASGAAYHPDAGSPEACAGHDLWLTQNRHGAGFWDRGMESGRALTDKAHKLPERSLYVLNKQVHIE